MLQTLPAKRGLRSRAAARKVASPTLAPREPSGVGSNNCIIHTWEISRNGYRKSYRRPQDTPGSRPSPVPMQACVRGTRPPYLQSWPAAQSSSLAPSAPEHAH